MVIGLDLDITRSPPRLFLLNQVRDFIQADFHSTESYHPSSLQFHWLNIIPHAITIHLCTACCGISQGRTMTANKSSRGNPYNHDSRDCRARTASRCNDSRSPFFKHSINNGPDLKPPFLSRENTAGKLTCPVPGVTSTFLGCW